MCIRDSSKEETGATWTAPFANGKIGVMPYPNTSTTALFDAEKDGGFEVGVAPIPGTKDCLLYTSRCV